jgi:hypothetical protein
MVQKSVGLNRMPTRLVVFCGLLALACALPTLETDTNAEDNALSLSEQLIDHESRAQDAQDDIENAEDAEVDLQAGQFMRKGMKYKYSKYKSMKVYKYKSHGYKSSYSKMGRHRAFYVYGMYGRPYGYHRYGYGRSQHRQWTRPENATEHLPKPTANSSVLVFVKSQSSSAADIRLAMWNRLKSDCANSPKLVENVANCYNQRVGFGNSGYCASRCSCSYSDSTSLTACLDQYMKVYFEQPTAASAVAQEDLQMMSDSASAFPTATSTQAYGWLEVMGAGSEDAAASLNNAINAGSLSSDGLKTGAGASVVLENPAPALSPVCSAAIAIFMASLVLLI